jgi:glycosyltransferase involved in cell wall biosynthesis
VRHQPHVNSEREMVSLLQAARGFVLMSWYENWCLSAHEAAACGLPLLLTDQNWSRERFGNGANYFANIGTGGANVQALKKFYDEAPDLAAPAIKLHSWQDVARALKKTYAEVLATKA